ncbi:MAG: 5-formyltetrahydrofolate cyclo-ligase [Candidatus Dadabacteria bacterium]|nr:5-formyltetrahydrofolate cyclo-ligase [Candidatus Dadabacteria bacterium]NIS07274.1 5-formyltetrahydrofolate cyclo-ligase [Candidatus Dadabacteria bacterium]NIY20931.1 5-formyltetrahydrofolate cyclo-ligase [Candidatus Dadabacteria bacterium]
MLSKTEIHTQPTQKKPDKLVKSQNLKQTQTQSKKNYSNNSSDSCINDYGSNEIKHSLRIHYLQKRLSLCKKDLKDKSVVISKNLINHPVYQNSEIIALYSPFCSEVDVLNIFDTNKKLGKKSCFPKVCGNTLRFYEVSEKSHLKPGSYGILEPTNRDCKELSTEDIDLFVIPAICIDYRGNRIGYGEGYYDRALSNIDSSKKVGLVFEDQITCTIPTEEFDKHMGYIATEAGVIKIRRRGN